MFSKNYYTPKQGIVLLNPAEITRRVSFQCLIGLFLYGSVRGETCTNFILARNSYALIFLFFLLSLSLNGSYLSYSEEIIFELYDKEDIILSPILAWPVGH
jgi:hypothetical protein